MKVMIKAGDRLIVEIEDSDGEFIIDYDSKGDGKLTVETDFPDDEGREGIIYCEDFGKEDLLLAKEIDTAQEID